MEYNTKEKWNKVYDDFDYSRKSVWREETTSFFTERIAFLKEKKLLKVLDAGCGDARNMIPFLEAGFEVTGVDFSASALEKCRVNCSGFDNVKLAEMNLEELEFEENSFDAVICDFVTAHMENIEKVISEFHRVLRKGGVLLIEFTSTQDPLNGKGEQIGDNEFLNDGFYIRLYTVEQVKSLLSEFEIKQIEAKAYSDPFHGPAYVRHERHSHHSFFVVAEK